MRIVILPAVFLLVGLAAPAAGGTATSPAPLLHHQSPEGDGAHCD